MTVVPTPFVENCGTKLITKRGVLVNAVVGVPFKSVCFQQKGRPFSDFIEAPLQEGASTKREPDRKGGTQLIH